MRTRLGESTKVMGVALFCVAMGAGSPLLAQSPRPSSSPGAASLPASNELTKTPDPAPTAPAASTPAETPPAAPAKEVDDATPAEFSGIVEGGVVGASPPTPSALPWSTQRSFALLASEGSYNGFGLGLRIARSRIALDSSFAFMPLLVSFQSDPDASPDFDLLTSFQINESVCFGLYRPDPRTDLGIALGYKYNSLLKHGVNVAFYLQRELGAHWALMGFAGPSIFPAAENEIRKKTGWTNGSVLSGIAFHQAGVGLSLAFFP
jgi:hypothetical protein